MKALKVETLNISPCISMVTALAHEKELWSVARESGDSFCRLGLSTETEISLLLCPLCGQNFMSVARLRFCLGKSRLTKAEVISTSHGVRFYHSNLFIFAFMLLRESWLRVWRKLDRGGGGDPQS